MTQPVEQCYGYFPVKPTLTIEIRIDVAKVIAALSGFALAIATIMHYL